jgi:hypothetical protein
MSHMGRAAAPGTSREEHHDAPGADRHRAPPRPHGQPQPPAVEQPKHPLGALTTYELRDYRRQLESAITSCQASNPVPPARDDLQARLDAVTAEQESRARIASA